MGAGRDWPKWDANKHLINVIATRVSELVETNEPRANAQIAINWLEDAVQLHSEIAQAGMQLRDDTNVYQSHWAAALTDLLNNNGADFDFLSMLP